MNTKRVLSEQDARNFFNTSINTIEDAFGHAQVDIKLQTIRFDFNAVLLLSFPEVYADTDYPLTSSLLEKHFVERVNLALEQVSDTSSFEYHRSTSSLSLHFYVKQQQTSNPNIRKFILICHEKLFDTEQQLDLFSRVVGSGLSLFSGSTWWIDYDKFSDHFFMSDTAANILGVPVRKDKIYNTQEFQKVREKARIVSEFYDESIRFETEAYEAVRNNKTDYFAGRTPTVTDKDEIVWVEAYGKCMLRYPDGSPRFFVAVDIYMSEIHEEKTQLELLNNLIDYGHINADVGIWYHQRHYLEGKYYFTESYQRLMANGERYRDDTISDIIDKQIQLLEEDGHGYESYLHEFRRVHNTIYTEGLDKYSLVIPNFRVGKPLQWIEVRGTVIERNDEGQVMLFVGVNVDITDSFNRRRELERLRIQNERLQLAENLAIKARNLLVWYQEISDSTTNQRIFGNEEFTSILGIPRSPEGNIRYSDIRKTIVLDEEEFNQARKLIEAFKDIYRGKKSSFDGLLVKHRNLITNDIIYMEHSVEVSDFDTDGFPRLVGGVILDVTQNILREQQIRYLADFDTLCDVHNRNYFERYYQTNLPSDYSILLYDLDGLKLINDVFGHIVGDTIIRQLASLLKEVFTDHLFICRIGGDEFAVLSPSTSTSHLTEQYDLLMTKIRKFNEQSDIEMTVSQGEKTVLNNIISFEKAFVQAENIMYRRKLNNRSSRKSKVLESIMETLNAKTEETKEHSDRMSELAVKTMHQLKMKRVNEIEDMKLLARVHDIGKITIDDNILKKPETLTPDEFELIKKHSEAGYKIIRNITDSDDVCNGVLLHHEHWDGSGYPQGLSGKDIPIFARIISVVDAFDAMTNNRVYSKKKTTEEAIEELKRCAGTQFDPRVVKAFIKACCDK